MRNIQDLPDNEYVEEVVNDTNEELDANTQIDSNDANEEGEKADEVSQTEEVVEK